MRRRKLLAATVAGLSGATSGCMSAALNETSYETGVSDRNCPPSYVKTDSFEVTELEGYEVGEAQFYASEDAEALLLIRGEEKQLLEPGENFTLGDGLEASVVGDDDSIVVETDNETGYCEVRRELPY